MQACCSTLPQFTILSVNSYHRTELHSPAVVHTLEKGPLGFGDFPCLISGDQSLYSTLFGKHGHCFWLRF